MRQVIVLPHRSAPVAGTWQKHSTQSHYKPTPCRPAMCPSTHLIMPSISKGATGRFFLRLLVCRGSGSNPQPSVPKAHALPLNHLGRPVVAVQVPHLLVAMGYSRVCNPDLTHWSPRPSLGIEGRTNTSLCELCNDEVVHYGEPLMHVA